MSSCPRVYMFVSFTAHLSACLSVCLSCHLLALSVYPRTSLCFTFLYLPLSLFSLSCPSFIRGSHNRTGTAETACQKVHSVPVSLHNMRTDPPPPTTVNALMCIRVMCCATCRATATGMSTMESKKAPTNKTRFHQSNG